MRTNLIIGLFLYVVLFAYPQKEICSITTSFGISDLLPESSSENENQQGTVSTDTIFLFKDTSSIILDTIKFDLFTGGKANHKLFLKNLSENNLPLNISVEYGSQNNYALEFNGLDGCVDCGNNNSLNITESITIEAWTYAYEWRGNRKILFKRTGGTYMLGNDNTQDSLIFSIESESNRWRILNLTPSEYAWHHIAAVYDYHSHRMAFYVDGYLTNLKEKVSCDVSNNDSSLFIGCQGIPHFDVFRPELWGEKMFYGFLDEVRLWKTARTKDEICKFMFTEITGTEPDLVGYWKFNEGKGEIALDASLNNNDGTLHGGIKYVRSTAPINVEWLSVIPALQIEHSSTQETWLSIDSQGLVEGEYWSKIIFFNSDDSLQNTYVSVLLSVTRAPDIKLITDTLNFNNCVIGQTKSQSLSIYNYGFDTLTITGISSSNTDFKIKKSGLPIPPYGSKKVEITYDPDLFGKLTGKASISNNDPDQPQITVVFKVDNIIIPGNTILRWIMYAVLLIALIILFFILSRYRLKQKANIRLNKEVTLALENQKKQQQIIIHQSRLTSLGQMASGIAHEVNQPLQNLLLAAESIQIELAETNPNVKYIKNLISEQYRDVDKISRISGHINFFSDSDKEDNEDRLDINQCIENAFALMQKQFENHHILAAFDLDKKIPESLGNPLKFEQVVVNLLNNARDAADEKGNQNIVDYQKQVEVVTGRQNNSVFMKVIDNGVGIPDEHISNIFLPYYTTKALGTGTGLGLSISYGIIRDMNGTIDVSSKPGDGTTFKISLPII